MLKRQEVPQTRAEALSLFFYELLSHSASPSVYLFLFGHVSSSSSNLKHQVSICLSTNACTNFHGFGAVLCRQSDESELY